MASPPVEVPQATSNPFKDISNPTTIPSCLASKMNSEKSRGQTLRN